MKKLSLILAIAIIFVAVFPLNAVALKVGDEIGDVLNTDIKTYINGQRIPSYNINNKSAVFIKDLANYGFDTVFNEKNRTTTVSYNPNKEATPLTSFEETTGKVGTVAFRYVYTDIVAIINGRRVECFNVKGYNAIYFSELSDYGTFVWDNEKRESRFTLTGTSNMTTKTPTESTTTSSTSTLDDRLFGVWTGGGSTDLTMKYTFNPNGTFVKEATSQDGKSSYREEGKYTSDDTTLTLLISFAKGTGHYESLALIVNNGIDKRGEPNTTKYPYYFSSEWLFFTESDGNIIQLRRK